MNILSRIWTALPFTGGDKPLVNVIELYGVIGASGPGKGGLSLKKLEKSIETAFKPGNLSAVALAINSPGGSPVQSRLIHDEIRRRAREKNVPVLTFVEDVGASGGYILAVAGDEVYADESSIVGSIGVISGGFGFEEAIKKLGVERRIYTAGENKSSLDPFKPEDPEDIERLQNILNDLHRQFIDLVKKRRSDKVSDSEDVYSGAFWAAPKAREMGLIDGTAQLNDFLRARFGKDVRIKRISPETGSLLKRLLSNSANPPASLVEPDVWIAAAENKALWARYGL